MLLGEQYAHGSELDPDGDQGTFHVQKGVGQGLLHAGDLADLIWYLAIEHAWATVESNQLSHGILGYFRFRDDMLIVAEDSPRYQQYLEGMFTRAAKIGYSVKVEFVSNTVPFLNVAVTVDKCAQKYGTKLHTKASDLMNCPLDPRSAQAFHVHAVWPRAMLSVAQKIEGCPSTAAIRMTNKFHAASLPPPPIASEVLADPLALSRPKKKRKLKSTENGNIWVPLPYHPLLAGEISRELARLSSDPEIMAYYKCAFKKATPLLRPAWKNAGPHHEMLIRSGAKKRKADAALVPRLAEGEQAYRVAGPLSFTEEAPVVVAHSRNSISSCISNENGRSTASGSASGPAAALVPGPKSLASNGAIRRARGGMFKFPSTKKQSSSSPSPQLFQIMVQPLIPVVPL